MSQPPQYPGSEPQDPAHSSNPQDLPQFNGSFSSPAAPSPYASSANSAAFPGAGGGNGEFSPSQPQKKRNWIWIVAGCGVLALIGLLVLGGCVALLVRSGNDDDVRTDDPVTVSSPAESSEDATEDPAEETAEEPAEDDAPADAVGTSRDNPAQPVTDAVEISLDEGTMAVTLGNVDWAADAKIAEANMFNEEAPEGEVYITVPVTVQYTGPASITPWLEVRVAYIAEDGRSYDEASVVVENDFMDVGDLYDGGVAEGEMAFLIPESAVGSGVFSVEGFMTGDPLFIAAV